MMTLIQYWTTRKIIFIVYVMPIIYSLSILIKRNVISSGSPLSAMWLPYQRNQLHWHKFPIGIYVYILRAWFSPQRRS
jgi:hypothetical protein